MTTTIAECIEQRFGIAAGGAVHDAPEFPGEDALVRILGRRTHRRYRDEPVDEALVEVLIGCALSASSKSDLQQASIVRVRNSERQAEIASWLPAMPWIGEAPVFLVFCGDNLRLRRAAALRGKPYPNNNVDAFMNAAVDAGLALQTFTLAAEAAGLGCCPISEVRTHIDRLTELLALPEGVFPVAGLCVGWPAREGFVSMRLPPALAVHEDVYDAAGLETKIDAYDRRRDARYRIPADRQREVERFGTAQFYGWSEDKTRQYSRPARPGFRDYLHRQGFALE
ncbi:MAG: nitroreductase family protein [Immundisolibacterales bacterium]|nr:nitroreductase family protein [Immundisolibacterales bacterium]